MRLTKISKKYGYCLRHSCLSANQCWDKLGLLEDIEDDLGIDLITLFKALKNGVYLKYKYGYEYRISKCRKCYLSGKKTFVVDYHTYRYLNDYGKTWALTKEELL